MKQLAVQVMRRAVITQVEPHHFEVGGKQALRQRQQVARVGTAFPAVQQYREPLARLEQQFFAGGAHRERAALDARAAPRPVGHDGLEMLAAQPARGLEGRIERETGHCAWGD